MSRPSQLTRHKWNRSEWHVVADERGRVVGRYQSPVPPIREEVETIKRLLITIEKGRKAEMAQTKTTAKQQEACNMVYLAGTLKFDPKVFDNAVKALIDVGMKASIQVGVFTGDNALPGAVSLANKLKCFARGDFIQVVAMLQPWGTKQPDNTWKNSISVEITNIKTDPPRPAQAQAPAADDNVPF